MKKFIFLLVLSFSWCNFLPAKILNIENKIQIEVPSSHKFIRYDNDEVRENIEEFINWISIFFPSAATESFPHMNKTIFDPNINWTKKTLIKANIKMYKYIA